MVIGVCEVCWVGTGSDKGWCVGWELGVVGRGGVWGVVGWHPMKKTL